jgi:hypothetical protein
MKNRFVHSSCLFPFSMNVHHFSYDFQDHVQDFSFQHEIVSQKSHSSERVISIYWDEIDYSPADISPGMY